MQVTPQRVRRWSVRVLVFSIPTTLLLLLGWAFEVLPADRPVLFLAMYLLAVGISVGATVTAVGSICHHAIGQAFGAGMRTSQPDQPDQQRRRDRLRLLK